MLHLPLTDTHLVNGDSVDISVVHKPDDLIGEELPVVLRGQIRLGRLRGVQLETLTDPLSEYVQGGVGLHDLGHGLLDERLTTWEPVTKGTSRRKKKTMYRACHTCLYIECPW